MSAELPPNTRIGWVLPASAPSPEPTRPVVAASVAERVRGSLTPAAVARWCCEWLRWRLAGGGR